MSGQASAKQAHVASALRNICAFEDACGIKRAHLGFEGAVLELEATLDCKRGRQAGGRADVNCLSVGETTAAEGILVKKVAFSRENWMRPLPCLMRNAFCGRHE